MRFCLGFRAELETHQHSLEDGMAETQHTPGPWTYDDEDGTIRAHGSVVAETAHSEYTTKQDVRNARLICAAPDLLHSLKEISAMFMARPDMVKAMQPLQGFAENAVFDRAAAAIAKAEGR